MTQRNDELEFKTIDSIPMWQTCKEASRSSQFVAPLSHTAVEIRSVMTGDATERTVDREIDWAMDMDTLGREMIAASQTVVMGKGEWHTGA